MFKPEKLRESPKGLIYEVLGIEVAEELIAWARSMKGRDEELSLKDE